MGQGCAGGTWTRRWARVRERGRAWASVGARGRPWAHVDDRGRGRTCSHGHGRASTGPGMGRDTGQMGALSGWRDPGHLTRLQDDLCTVRAYDMLVKWLKR